MRKFWTIMSILGIVLILAVILVAIMSNNNSDTNQDISGSDDLGEVDTFQFNESAETSTNASGGEGTGEPVI